MHRPKVICCAKNTMKISCAWWNTALSPTKKPNRTNDVQRKLSMAVIGHFLLERRVDFLGLCEVSKEDVAELKVHCQSHGYAIESGVHKDGQAVFDCCAIYQPEKLTFLSQKFVKAYSSKQSKMKVANHMLFTVNSSKEELHFLLSHWPHVGRMNRGTPARLEYGEFLRQTVEGIWGKDPNALIVLMGDYNDEPFDDPLSLKLRATRDAHLIRGKASGLYNPFWRRLGCSRGYDRAENSLTYAGTYFYKTDKVDRWRTYDQIIFSSAFLGGADWHLDEKSVGVVDFPEYTEQVLSTKTIFDHLPITATVERHAP